MFVFLCYFLQLCPTVMEANTTSLLISIAMPVFGIIVVIFSWVTFTWIEKPFIKLGKKISGWLSNKIKSGRSD